MLSSLAASALLLSPRISLAQADSGENAIAQRQVSVDAENTTLYSVITALMQSAGANYTLDTGLRNIRVTAHLHGIRMETALNVLLRSATPAYTYRLEAGVYRFLPKVDPTEPGEEPGATSTPTQSGIKRIQALKVNFIDAAEVASLLGGIPIRTSNGQTYGLIDPIKLDGRIIGGNGGSSNGAASPASGNKGGGTAGASGGNSTLPPNLFDYLWVVNAGAGY